MGARAKPIPTPTKPQTQLLTDLFALRDLFKPDGSNWIKNTYKRRINGQDCFCLAGGMIQVVDPKTMGYHGLLEERVRAMARAIGFDTVDAIMHYNDEKQTTFKSMLYGINEAIRRNTPKQPYVRKKPK